MIKTAIKTITWLAILPATFAFMPAHAETYTVNIKNLVFTPTEIKVHVGDTVEWVNQDIVDHTATARSKEFNIKLPKGAKGATILTKPETIDYICTLHPNMKGRIVVEAK